MKQLDKLEGEVEKHDMDLDNFLATAPILLDEKQEYRFEIDGNTVEIYGLSTGIKDYAIQRAGVGLISDKNTEIGIEIKLSHKGIDKLVLHANAYKKNSRLKTEEDELSKDVDNSTGNNSDPDHYSDWERHARGWGKI